MRPTCFIVALTFVSLNCGHYRAPERICNCADLLTKQSNGFYLKYLNGEDTFYTGKCKLTRENGNEITYEYLKGHLLSEIERYPDGILHEDMLYDTSGRILKRARYYPSGHISYKQIIGNHTYETFYDNGRIERKGGYGFTNGDKNNRYFDMYDVRLYDSIWKQTGEFDSVYRYSKASITY